MTKQEKAIELLENDKTLTVDERYFAIKCEVYEQAIALLKQPPCERCEGSGKVSTCCKKQIEMSLDGWRCSQCKRHCKNELDFVTCPDCKGTGMQPACSPSAELPKRLQNIFDDIHTLLRNKCSGELFTRLCKAKDLLIAKDKTIAELQTEIRKARKGTFGFMIKSDETLCEGMARNYAEFDDARTDRDKTIAEQEETLNEIKAVSCGEKQVAEDDSEGMGWIYRRCIELDQALKKGE